MSPPAHRPRPATLRKFHSLDIGAPIAVKLALLVFPDDVRACLHELRSFGKGRLFLVARLPGESGYDDWMALLDTATPLGGQVALVATPGMGSLRAGLRHQSWACPVAVESHPQPAVARIMSRLSMGDTLAVLWPESGVGELLSVVVQTARSRRSWEAPEDGAFPRRLAEQDISCPV